MSDEEMNSCRFNSGEEPSDEMLSRLMKEVAQEAAESNKKATEAYFANLRLHAAEGKAKWAERIKNVTNG